jgi:hypothetical protein
MLRFMRGDLDFLVKNRVVWDRLSTPDRMDSIQRRNSPREWPNPKEVISPGARGSGVVRPLGGARAKGAVSPTSGRVLGMRPWKLTIGSSRNTGP